MKYSSKKLKENNPSMNEDLLRAIDENEAFEFEFKEEIEPNESIVIGRVEGFINLYVKDIPFLFIKRENESDVFETIFYVPIRDRDKKDEEKANIDKCGKLKFDLYKIGFVSHQITSIPFPSKLSIPIRVFKKGIIENKSIDVKFSGLPEILTNFINIMTELEQKIEVKYLMSNEK